MRYDKGVDRSRVLGPLTSGWQLGQIYASVGA